MTIYARVTHNQKPTYHDIVIYQGATFSDTVTIREVSGIAFDLSDYDVRGTIKRTSTAADSEDLAFEATISDATGGDITLALSAADTGAMEAENGGPTWYVYDVEIYQAVDSDTPVEIVYRVVQGRALLEPEL